ncbi:hypothetical protein OHA79_01315 [Streptomyces sp. NBC_00841]|uniref:hypothetical protein n=1 Tax=Streptomyces sp. NBC_00841 TaxID=2975847 RepID=UPI002DD86742|nr:hypothetical protein [Streptomyces sp. NBC_00841]WRZ96705.1 hypothetical protein OHA79_01315 [Streptomyces sp. NBC_00841]
MQIAQDMDWGTVPAWFSAILSGGSVILALYIILRDRKKAERSDALKLICWDAFSNEAYTTHVINASDRAVHGVQVVCWLKGQSVPGEEYVFERFGVASDIRPGEEKTVATPRWLGDDRGQKCIPWAVEFQDSDGLHWVRDLQTGRLHEQNQSPRLFSRYTLMHWREVWRKRRMIRAIAQRRA